MAAVVASWQLADVEYDGTDMVILDPLPPTLGKQIAQVVFVKTGAVATGAAGIPNDDTIPQNTEGDQFMSLAITPTNAGSTLEISVVFFGNEATNTSDCLIVALFQDAIANALACGVAQLQGFPFGPTCCTFTHMQSAGSTSTQTFKVRAGLNNANTMVFNGSDGSGSTGRKFGGVLASSIKITEFLP